MNRTERGDTVTAVKLTGRRVILSPSGSLRRFSMNKADRGFTLIELVITITVLTILTMGVVPLLKLSVKRQKEQQLRDSLRQIRTAIDEFHRDTIGMQCNGIAITNSGGAGGGGGAPAPGGPGYIDPRSKVVITDCTVFGVDNPDRYPPSLETLRDGVNVIPRGNATGAGVAGVNATDVGNPQLAEKKKVYLRSIPIDPMTGHADWCLKSNYDEPGADCGGQENVFDVHSKSGDKALNGDKYSDW